MASDKQVQLNLRLTATDEASKVLDGFVQGISESVKAIQEALKGAFNPAELESAARDAQTVVDDAFKSMADASLGGERAMGESASVMGRDMAELATAINRTASEVGRSVDEMRTAVDRMGSATHHMSTDTFMGLETLAQGAEKVGRTIGDAFMYCVEQAADFDTSMAQVNAVLSTSGGATTAQLAKMKQTALDLGLSSKYSANEIGQGMYDLARQGLDASQILGNGVNGAIEVTNNLAQATDTNMKDTASVITDVMHEFGLSGDQLVTVSNMISGAMHNSSISMTDFYQTMKQVGPVASSMHQSVNDVSTAIALLAQHGIKGSSAGTALKNMLLGLTPSTDKAAAAFKALGLSTKNGASNGFFDLQGKLKPMPQILDILHQHMNGLSDAQKQMYLHTIFTKYGLAGMNILIGESGKAFGDLSAQLKKDDAATIAQKKMNSLGGDIHKLQAAVQTMAKSFGEALEPELRMVAQAAQHVAQWFGHLSDGTKKTIMAVMAVTAVLATLTGVVISLGLAFSMALPGLTFMAERFGILGPLMAGGGREATAFTRVLGSLKGAIGTVGKAIMDIMMLKFDFGPMTRGASKLVSVFSSGAPKLLTWGGLLTGLKRPITLFADAIGNLHLHVEAGFKAIGSAITKAGQLIYTAIPRMMASFTRLGALIYTSGPRILAAITSAFTWENVVKKVQEASTAIRTAMTLMLGPWGILIAAVLAGVIMIILNWNKIKDWVTQHFGGTMPNVLNQLKSTFTKVWSDIQKALEQAWNYIKPTVLNGLQQVSQWWNQHWTQIQQVLKVILGVCLAILAPSIAIMMTIITAGIGFIKGAWTSGWHAIGDLLKMVWSVMQGVVSVAWHVISGIISVALDLLTGHFRQAGSDFINIFKNVFSDLKGMFSSLAQEAFSFGQNFVNMMANGIRSAAGAVVSAAKSVASSIAGMLGFHSPTKEGPASDSDTWGPNFVRMFAGGLSDGKSTMSKVAQDLIQPLSDTLSGKTTLSVGGVSVKDMNPTGDPKAFTSSVSGQAMLGQVQHQVSAMVNTQNLQKLLATGGAQMPVANGSNGATINNFVVPQSGRTAPATVNIYVDGKQGNTNNDLANAIAGKVRTQMSVATTL